MSKQKAVKHAVRNEDYYRAMVEVRRSSAASKHTPKPRKGTRTAQQSRALRDWRN
ncbi:hypothetical protein [Citricoccus nitrophenolicus]|uniref:hypothetical protein n=1 Tax=Citricoccus nitrophenolicus TaxID=863575 RepID=UPI0031EA30B3